MAQRDPQPALFALKPRQKHALRLHAASGQQHQARVGDWATLSEWCMAHAAKNQEYQGMEPLMTDGYRMCSATVCSMFRGTMCHEKTVSQVY